MSASEDEGNNRPEAAGRVRHDSNGRAVWEWAATSGRRAIDTTSRLLKRLDLPGLSLADEDAGKLGKKPDARGPANQGADPVAGGQSFNPYDNPKPVRRPDSRPVAKPALHAATAPPKRGLIARILGRK